MSDQRFDLTKRPWIRARLRTGDIVELSLTEVFERAHVCTALAGELSTQDFALLRLLLAIVRRCHPDAKDAADWSDLWQRGSIDVDTIAAYLDHHHSRFDLLHSETPFYQVAALRTAKGQMTGIGRLVADVPAEGKELFTTRASKGLTSMTFAEAARWIVHCQAFDVAGIKSGASGDPKARQGKCYPDGVAWCGLLGGIAVEGSSLFQTLLLNLPLVGRANSRTDLPAWERPPQTAASDRRQSVSGPIDLLTWQSRRLRLGIQQGRVTGVLVTYGDRLQPGNKFRDEFMTNWRFNEYQTKAERGGIEVFTPISHRPDRAMWRGLESLLAFDANAGGSQTYKPGKWLTWLAELRHADCIPHSLPLRVRATGVHYEGPNNPRIGDVTNDVMTLSIAVMTEPEIKALACDAVRVADAVVRCLAILAVELAEAAGMSGDNLDGYRSAAREQGYAALDWPYRRWLANLTSDSVRDEVRSAWQVQVRQLLTQLGRDLIRNAGKAAWIGREVNRGNDRTIYLDAAIAENGFHHRLRQALPLAYHQPVKEMPHDHRSLTT